MDLRDYMYAEYASAKRFWAMVLGLEMIVFVVAAVSTFIEDHTQAFTAALIGAVLSLTSFLLREYAGDRYRSGERVRRMILFRDGLGKGPSEHELAQIEADAAQPVRQQGGAYFSSELPQGPARLAMHLQESAFFTARLARPLSRWCAGVAGVGILGIVILVALSSQVPASAGLHTAARAFAVVFGFFAAGLFVSFWRTFAHVADTAATTADRCDAMRRDPAVDLTEVFRVMQDYDAALASAPPIPEFVHRLRAARLTGAWERHISSSGSAAAAPTTQNRS